MARAALACALLAIAASADARSIPMRAPGGAPSPERCSSTCYTSISSIPGWGTHTSVPDYDACAAKMASGQELIGYQLDVVPSQDGQTCTVLSDGAVVVSTNYTCLCKTEGQADCLHPPGPSGTCADSCALNARSKPLRRGDSYACLPQTEQQHGKGRYGTVAGRTCAYAGESGPAADASFSCVCLFPTSSLPPSPEAARISYYAPGYASCPQLVQVPALAPTRASG